MAIGVYFAPSNMSTAQYDTVVKKLAAAGAGSPQGRHDHSCFGDGGKPSVFDVWDSQASFERFGETLMPILKEVGIDGGSPQIMPIHNVIVGK